MQNKAQPQKVGRLAMRTEGEWWNAYYALPDTMDRAVHLGSISMNLIRDNSDLKTAFMDLMRVAVTDIMKATFGQTPTWPEGPQAAPEHERSGRS